jgi:RNA polymerase sigma-70 factor (ECF subfamily)
MHEHTARLPGPLVTADAGLAYEFERLLAETSTLAFRVAFSVLRHEQDAEDVAQEAFLRAYRGFTRLRDRDRFRAWLVRTTWRAALDRQRSNRRRGSREVDDAGRGVVQAESRIGRTRAQEDSRRTALWHAIDRLPGKLRITLVLASIEGYDVRAVGALLGIPEGTVKSRLSLARQRLREMLR